VHILTPIRGKSILGKRDRLTPLGKSLRKGHWGKKGSGRKKATFRRLERAVAFCARGRGKREQSISRKGLIFEKRKRGFRGHGLESLSSY